MRSFKKSFWRASLPIRISFSLLLLERFFSEVAAANKNNEEEKEAPTHFYTKAGAHGRRIQGASAQGFFSFLLDLCSSNKDLIFHY